MKIRLQKIISQNSNYSRRAAEKLIEEKKVLVNGKVANIGDSVEIPGANIEIEFEPLKIKKQKLNVIAFNKPMGIISSMKGENSLEIFFEKYSDRYFHIGRLDKDSHGLILLTNNGSFAQKISHPSNKILKTYVVKVDNIITSKIIQKLCKGFKIHDKTHDFVKFDSVKVLHNKTKNNILEVKLHSGKNRIIKRAFEELKINVLDLQRIQIGSIKLGELKLLRTRFLNENEIKSFMKKN